MKPRSKKSIYKQQYGNMIKFDRRFKVLRESRGYATNTKKYIVLWNKLFEVEREVNFGDLESIKGIAGVNNWIYAVIERRSEYNCSKYERLIIIKESGIESLIWNIEGRISGIFSINNEYLIVIEEGSCMVIYNPKLNEKLQRINLMGFGDSPYTDILCPRIIYKVNESSLGLGYLRTSHPQFCFFTFITPTHLQYISNPQNHYLEFSLDIYRDQTSGRECTRVINLPTHILYSKNEKEYIYIIMNEFPEYRIILYSYRANKWVSDYEWKGIECECVHILEDGKLLLGTATGKVIYISPELSSLTLKSNPLYNNLPNNTYNNEYNSDLSSDEDSYSGNGSISSIEEREFNGVVKSRRIDYYGVKDISLVSNIAIILTSSPHITILHIPNLRPIRNIVFRNQPFRTIIKLY